MSAMTSELSEPDRRLLDYLQREVPLARRPYQAIADAVGQTEDAVLDRVRALSGAAPAPIRQISAIFDSKALGYESCLVAAKVDPARIAAAAEVINQHPGVSHNYRREHAYNLWFTVAVPPDSQLGLERTVTALQRLSGADQMRLMPAIKLYKIGVRFDLGVDGAEAGSSSPVPGGDVRAAGTTSITAGDRAMIRVLQQHLPVDPLPFDAWAAQAGVEVDQLLAAARHYVETGIMRRFSAVLRHRAIGVSANAMGVWVVAPDQYDAFGAAAAAYPAVSHCYLRPTYPDWPYAMFTMVHGKTRPDCEATLAAIADATGVRDYTSLYSTTEYKKVRVKYFTGDIARWEAATATATA